MNKWKIIAIILSIPWFVALFYLLWNIFILFYLYEYGLHNGGF